MRGQQPSKVIPHAEASGIWKLYGFSAPDELVLEDLALAMGVLVLDGPLEGADARLLRKGSKGLIRVKDTIPETGRRRFAIAHELGHWILHKKVSQVLACTSEDMLAQYKASEPEIEANYFAAALLMPEGLFTPRIKAANPSTDLVKSLATYFDTSLTATAIRYVELSDEYCAVVISENGKVRWWRASEQFEDQFWIEPGTPLSRHTVAGSVLYGEKLPRGPEKVDIGAWLSESSGYESDSIMEQVISLERYGQMISLLWLP
jgi:Zn-dependent peptidase ImmA (M78 family)